MHEITVWATALLTLTGLGLSLGLNPALYGATADMLARGLTPWQRLSWMVGGLFTGATILFALLQTFNPASIVSLVQHKMQDALFNRTFELVAGIVFLLLGASIAVWAMRVKKLPEQQQKPPKQNANMLSYFTIGLSSSIIGFTTLPIMYLTGRITAGLNPELLPRLLAYSVFLLALGAPFFAIAWIWGRFPQLSTRITGLYSRMLHWDYRWASAVICVLVGFGCIALAIIRHS